MERNKSSDQEAEYFAVAVPRNPKIFPDHEGISEGDVVRKTGYGNNPGIVEVRAIIDGMPVEIDFHSMQLIALALNDPGRDEFKETYSSALPNGDAERALAQYRLLSDQAVV